MKKGLITLILSTLFVFNVFGQEVFTSIVDTENSIYKNGNVKMVLLKKYDVLKDDCVKNYFPSLSKTNILVGEDLINFLDKDNVKTNLDVQSAIFYKANGIKYIVFNGNYFFNKEESKRLICHELAHLSSGSLEHDSLEYKTEIARLKKLGVDINTHTDCSLLYECIK